MIDPQQNTNSGVIRLLREPLLHFFFAGAALLAFSLWLAPGEASVNEQQIVVTDETREYLNARFRRVWRRDPTSEEAQRAIDEWVKEEILFREGMALGLADDDAIVRRRVGQKVMMLAGALVPPLPDESSLREWYEERRDAYALPGVYSFEQCFFNGENAPARANAALTKARTGVTPGGDSTLLPATLEAANENYVAANFGEAFSAALDELPTGEWSGPIESSFGLHLVLLKSRSAGTSRSFEAARDDVERDWIYENRSSAREHFYDELRAGYEVLDDKGAEAAR